MADTAPGKAQDAVHRHLQHALKTAGHRFKARDHQPVDQQQHENEKENHKESHHIGQPDRLAQQLNVDGKYVDVKLQALCPPS
ncbi:hypothetical protein SDC9_187967 [bioreactor metagenome]|uniref:Uncharacterized protein n=1 Tax=bioreactor metagenome TaxID=1076179 RepID=A0A645HNM2_9ZZZZ